MIQDYGRYLKYVYAKKRQKTQSFKRTNLPHSPLSKPVTPQSIQCQSNVQEFFPLHSSTIPIKTIHKSKEDLLLAEALLQAPVPEEDQIKFLPLIFHHWTKENHVSFIQKLRVTQGTRSLPGIEDSSPSWKSIP